MTKCGKKSKKNIMFNGNLKKMRHILKKNFKIWLASKKVWPRTPGVYNNPVNLIFADV